MSSTPQMQEGMQAELLGPTVAWSYEWYGDADDGPTRWHKRLSEHHPTHELPANYAKDYRNIRPLAYADVAPAGVPGAM